MPDTAIDKILKALQQKEQSTAELSEHLNLPLGTARSVVCFTTKAGFTEPIPITKRSKDFKPETTPGKRRGKNFRLTEKGKEYLKGK
jgi:hypothetical protein